MCDRMLERKIIGMQPDSSFDLFIRAIFKITHDRAAHFCHMNTDLVLALGSSLVVEPAASIPLQAKNNGARLVIINRTDTPLDGLADVVVHESIGSTLSQVMTRLGCEIKNTA